MRSSSCSKPKSSKRSASSSTRVCTADSSSALCSIRSSRRPGVATTMSAPPRKPIICGLIDTPPNTTVTLTGCASCRASNRATSPICTASSRVGTKIKALTRLCRPAGGSWFSARACKTGRQNASVLPEPVSAETSTSRPASTRAIAWACTGVGVSKPWSASARRRVGDRPRKEKDMLKKF